MPPSRSDWATAYAAQSASDLDVFEILAARKEVPRCHSLHYLQMACEKIAKAYLFRDTATAEARLTSGHVAFTSFINAFFRSAHVKNQYVGKDAHLRLVSTHASQLAREIEKLAPAVDAQESPSNAEYPWLSGDQLIVPCRYDYPNLSSLREADGIRFLKIVKEAIVDFDRLVLR